MPAFVPCAACSRHVRLDEPACPFCASRLNASRLRERYTARFRSLPAPLSRAALYAMGTALVAQTACESREPAESPNVAAHSTATSNATASNTTASNTTASTTHATASSVPTSYDWSESGVNDVQLYGAPIPPGKHRQKPKPCKCPPNSVLCDCY